MSRLGQNIGRNKINPLHSVPLGTQCYVNRYTFCT